MNLKTPEYQSGSCNIGGAEVRRREFFAIFGTVLSLAYWVASFSLHTHWGVRALVFFPLVFATIGWYQARRKFCLAYGLVGLFNFGSIGQASRIMDPELRLADRAQAFRILAQATVLAAVFALIFTLIPA